MISSLLLTTVLSTGQVGVPLNNFETNYGTVSLEEHTEDRVNLRLSTTLETATKVEQSKIIGKQYSKKGVSLCSKTVRETASKLAQLVLPQADSAKKVGQLYERTKGKVLETVSNLSKPIQVTRELTLSTLGNVADIILTGSERHKNLGHRALAIKTIDSEWVVIDPYYLGGNKISLEQYLLRTGKKIQTIGVYSTNTLFDISSIK